MKSQSQGHPADMQAAHAYSYRRSYLIVNCSAETPWHYIIYYRSCRDRVGGGGGGGGGVTTDLEQLSQSVYLQAP